MTTRAEMQTSILRDVRDPDSQTFSVDDVNDWIALAIASVSTFSPLLFQEDLTPDPTAYKYQLVNGTADRRTTVRRVEVWDMTQTPPMLVETLWPASGAAASGMPGSAAGWEVWDGWLWLPYIYTTVLDPTRHAIRVWGYTPHAQPAQDTDVLDLLDIEEAAVREFAQMTAYQRLLNSRALFAQWQTTPSNTDITEATLIGLYNASVNQWMQRKRELVLLQGNN